MSISSSESIKSRGQEQQEQGQEQVANKSFVGPSLGHIYVVQCMLCNKFARCDMFDIDYRMGWSVCPDCQKNGKARQNTRNFIKNTKIIPCRFLYDKMEIRDGKYVVLEKKPPLLFHYNVKGMKSSIQSSTSINRPSMFYDTETKDFMTAISFFNSDFKEKWEVFISLSNLFTYNTNLYETITSGQELACHQCFHCTFQDLSDFTQQHIIDTYKTSLNKKLLS